MSAELAPVHLEPDADALLTAEEGNAEAAHVNTCVEEPLAVHLNIGASLRLVEVRDGVGCARNVHITELRIRRLDFHPFRVGHAALQKRRRLAAEEGLAPNNRLEEHAARCRNLTAVRAAPNARLITMQLHLHPVGCRPLGLEPDVVRLLPVEANVDIGATAAQRQVRVEGECAVGRLDLGARRGNLLLVRNTGNRGFGATVNARGTHFL